MNRPCARSMRLFLLCCALSVSTAYAESSSPAAAVPDATGGVRQPAGSNGADRRDDDEAGSDSSLYEGSAPLGPGAPADSAMPDDRDHGSASGMAR